MGALTTGTKPTISVLLASLSTTAAQKRAGKISWVFCPPSLVKTEGVERYLSASWASGVLVDTANDFNRLNEMAFDQILCVLTPQLSYRMTS